MLKLLFFLYAGVKKLLKSKWAPLSEEQLNIHDAKVRQRWKALHTGKGLQQLGIAKKTLELIREGTIKSSAFVESADPIQSLPTGENFFL